MFREGWVEGKDQSRNVKRRLATPTIAPQEPHGTSALKIDPFAGVATLFLYRCVVHGAGCMVHGGLAFPLIIHGFARPSTLTPTQPYIPTSSRALSSSVVRVSAWRFSLYPPMQHVDSPAGELES